DATVRVLSSSRCLWIRNLWCRCYSFFFFKQKTAYEIGLGIPAEPLFRSTLFPNALRDYFRDIGRMVLAAEGRSEERFSRNAEGRSEERRVGKECGVCCERCVCGEKVSRWRCR